MRILIVESLGFLRHQFQLWLEECGHQTESVPHGRDALTLMRERHFPLVITNLETSGMDGIELFIESQLISHRGTIGQPQRSRFILITMSIPGRGSARQVQVKAHEALEVGFEAVLEKPLTKDILVRAVGAIDRAQNRQQGKNDSGPSLLVLLKEIRQISGDLANSGRNTELQKVHGMLKQMQSTQPTV